MPSDDRSSTLQVPAEGLPPAGRTTREPLAATLFAFVLAFLVVTAAGRIDNVDTQHVLATTSSLLQDGDFDIRNNLDRVLPALVSSDRHGRVFAHWNVGTTAVQVPFYLVGAAAAGLVQRLGWSAPPAYVREFSVSFVSPVFGALTVLVFYGLGRWLGIARRPAAITSLVVLLASLLWPYSKSSYLEIVQAFFLTGAAWSLGRLADDRTRDVRNAGAAGLCLAGLLLMKIAFAVLLPVLLAYPLLRRRATPGRAWSAATALALAGPVAAAAAGTLVFNALRFGDPLVTGYSEAFTMRIHEGFAFQLVSFQQGLFLYSPVVVLALLAATLVPAPRRAFVGWLLAIALVHVMLYSAHHLWRVNGWGPRYLVPILPLLLVPLFFLCASWGRLGRGLRAGAAGVIALSFALQLPPFLNAFDQYWVLEAELRSGPLPPAEGRAPPVLVLPKLLAPKLAGRPAVYDAREFGAAEPLRIDHTVHPGLRSLNFWFVYAAEALHSRLPYAAAAAGLLLTGWLGWRLAATLRAPNELRHTAGPQGSSP
ncbi:MAG: phospholipid carrier-dependent glycosyltransferase [Gemmatimonadota bacterium]